jgi:type II secretory pathway pseudopilin PulG
MDREGSGSIRRAAGYSLLEVVAVLLLLGLLSLVGIGSYSRLAAQSSTRALSQVVRCLMTESATRAVSGRTYVGIVFEKGERGAVAQLVEDGDWDGVTHEDLLRGEDRALGSRVYLSEGQAYLGLPGAVRTDPAGSRIPDDDPVRFGRGDILSFSPTGTSTPGSLYLRDVAGKEAWAFRVAGLDGRVRCYRWWRGKWSEVK